MNPQAEIQRLCAALENGEIDRTAFLEHSSRLVAVEVGCSRAGVWVFRDTSFGRTLHCLAMHDRLKGGMTAVPDDSAGEPVAAYFHALEQVGYVMATDARTHFATAGFFPDRLAPRDVQSVMAASFSVNGKLHGAFTCAQAGRQMVWTRPQLNVLRQIGSRASLALAAHAIRTAMDTRPAPLQ
jgi:GAF domain-containing protein